MFQELMLISFNPFNNPTGYEHGYQPHFTETSFSKVKELLKTRKVGFVQLGFVLMQSGASGVSINSRKARGIFKQAEEKNVS